MSFKRLDSEDFLISSDSITATLWSDFLTTLTNFFTSSAQEASSAGSYYLSVYQTSSALTNAETQFDIAYGDSKGSGSAYFDSGVTGVTPTKSIFGQYRSLVLGDENSSFIFGNLTSSNILVLSIDRNRYKESLFPGSLSLKLTSGSNSLILTDDSRITTTNVFTDAGRLYNIVSGSAGTVYTGVNSTGWSAASGSYGWFLPDIGTIILNPQALKGAAAAGGIILNVSQSNNSDGKNTQTLYKAISASGAFLLNSQETITSDYVFIRPRNLEFNYSENPSFISGSTGAVLYDSFIYNPEVYITTVGLYNDNNELLAVAKLSRPLKKNFTTEELIRVKLDF